MGENQRLKRVGSLIREEISEMITRGLNEPLPSFVTVTDVDVAPDLGMARIWLSVFGDRKEKDQALEVLTNQAWAIRQELGRRVRLRRTPELRFFLDETLERADRINQLLAEAARRSPDYQGEAVQVEAEDDKTDVDDATD